MNYKSFLTVSALSLALIAPIAYAQEITTPTISIDPVVTTDIVLTPEQLMANELADLKIKAADPSTGWFARFMIKIKISELTNKLQIVTALQ